MSEASGRHVVAIAGDTGDDQSVKALVEAHGGRVTVANQPAGGAVFTVELPATAGDNPLPIASLLMDSPSSL